MGVLKKKVCSVCVERKYKREYYRQKSSKDGYMSMCKECNKARLRNAYARTRKVPDGIKFDKTGRKVMHKGCSTSIYWDGNMTSLLKRHFATTLNYEMAEMLEVSVRTMLRKARELGLEKDPVWMKKVFKDRALLANVASVRSGNSGVKPGHKFWGNKYTGKLNKKDETMERKTMEELFEDTVEQFKKDKHEFDKASRDILHDVFIIAYKEGYDAGKEFRDGTIDSYSTWREPGVQAF